MVHLVIAAALGIGASTVGTLVSTGNYGAAATCALITIFGMFVHHAEYTRATKK